MLKSHLQVSTTASASAMLLNRRSFKHSSLNPDCIGALHVGVLNRLAGFDEVQAYASLTGPGVLNLPCEFRSVVHHYSLRRSSKIAYPFKDLRHSGPRQGDSHLDGQVQRMVSGSPYKAPPVDE